MVFSEGGLEAAMRLLHHPVKHIRLEALRVVTNLAYRGTFRHPSHLSI